MNPLLVYLLALSALCRLALTPWNGPLPETVVLYSGNVAIELARLDAALAKTNYLIRAIVHLLTLMREGKSGFFECRSIVEINNRIVASVIFFRPTPRSLGVAGVSVPINTNFPGQTLQGQDMNSSLSTTSSVFNDGWYRIDILHDYTIRWRKSGDTIPSQEIFLMFVDVLTEAAQHDYKSTCSYTDGSSPFPAQAVFHMNPDGDADMRWKHVTILIANLLLKGLKVEKVFAEVDFELLQHGAPLAQGFILKLPPPGISNTTATL